ncbi:MAG: 50S ribosomal protein L4, partial [Actinomycetota bacterium]
SDTPSTKSAIAALGHAVGTRRALVVLARDDEVSVLSLRNVPSVHVLYADQLNTYDVLVNDDVVFTSGALEAFLGGNEEEE